MMLALTNYGADTAMTYVVTENCIACKYTDCVDSCPVDCFHEGEVMLVINPDECIDCGVCVPECPADAISPDSAPEVARWVTLNRELSQKWPILYNTKEPLSDADEHDGQDRKFDTHFTDKAATQAA